MNRNRRISVILTSLLLVTGTACSNPYTPAGHEGYVYERPRIMGEGGSQGVVTGPGNFGMSVLRNEVINIDIRPSTYTEEFKILARDDLNVAFRVHAVIAIESGHVEQVVTEYGGLEWYPRYAKEPFRTLVRNSVQAHESRDIKNLRDEIANDVHTRLSEYLEPTPFRVSPRPHRTSSGSRARRIRGR